MATSDPLPGNHSSPDTAEPNNSSLRSGDRLQQTMVPPLTVPPPSASASTSTPQPFFGASVPAYSSPTTSQSPWSPGIPSSPPPPYDPSRPPAIYSPFGPPSSFSSPPPQYPPSTPWPYAQDGFISGSSNSPPHKIGPALARRRRKMQLIALALCAVMMIIFALIMGVLMGIVKLQWQGGDDN
ncbi:hypothetical protein FIE12Z_4827 [Fusarium flagelliforme]|uniref:Uncharacterized protein n=1 Tax=Fusarium flagelliforme TaxID=2675880 RepID=A0A395MSF2_9HYPO|nr:hypothetical protein FIE12Z_4827 [Fusarium flagelliforme]